MGPVGLMALPPRVYDASGRLTAEAITALVRRVWWSEPSEGMPVVIDKSDPSSWQKSVRLQLWFSPDRLPLWLKPGVWYSLPDGFQVLVDGTLLEAWLS